ncbi:MAG: hypothetical protein PUG10_02970 [Lachnospiraceae bacterium]|nr:hypothetical protein [Lachnospiraceae bacterium]
MKIWQLNFELDTYDNLIPIRDFTVEEIQSFDGRSHLSNWKPIKVKRMEPKKGLALSDAPGFIIPVFSKRAVNCIGPLISKNVEILPLDFNEREYFCINVITVLNAIDYEKSLYKTYRDGKRIMAFKKYVFIPNIIENVSIFKISDEKTRYAFVSDEFKQTVEKNKLLGFKFKLIWDSEQE